MATFYGRMQGNRKEVTRTGHSYLRTENNGWTQGIRVIGSINESGTVVHEVFLTGGSNYPGKELFLGVLENGEWFNG